MTRKLIVISDTGSLCLEHNELNERLGTSFRTVESSGMDNGTNGRAISPSSFACL